MKVIVQCADRYGKAIKLKLTLTEELLGKSLSDAVVGPFLGVFNKKVGGSPLAPSDLLGYSVDGGPRSSELDAVARSVLASEAPTLVLEPPPPPPLSPTESLVEALLVPPDDADADYFKESFRAVRLAVASEGDGEGKPRTAELFAPRLIALAAERACVAHPALV